MSARRILEKAMRRHNGLDNNNNDDENTGFKPMYSREEERALERGVYVQVRHVLCQNMAIFI